MFTLSKTFRFEASHQLTEHDGKCARLHGHSWVATVTVCGKRQQTEGPGRNMLVDFYAFGSLRNWIDANYDHKHLNDVLSSVMPTSEEVAKDLWTVAQELLIKNECPDGVFLRTVEVEETCTSKVTYWYEAED